MSSLNIYSLDTKSQREYTKIIYIINRLITNLSPETIILDFAMTPINFFCAFSLPYISVKKHYIHIIGCIFTLGRICTKNWQIKASNVYIRVPVNKKKFKIAKIFEFFKCNEKFLSL